MHRATKYVVAVGIVVIALGLKDLFATFGADHPFLLLPAAVILASWYGGRGPGTLATVVAAIAADVLFLDPRGLSADPGELLALAALTAEGLLIVAITVGSREARERAVRDASEADRARRSATLALQLREELLRLWTQKLAGPLAHVGTSAQRARDAVRSTDQAAAAAALDALAEDVALLQRTAERLIDDGGPERPAS